MASCHVLECGSVCSLSEASLGATQLAPGCPLASTSFVLVLSFRLAGQREPPFRQHPPPTCPAPVLNQRHRPARLCFYRALKLPPCKNPISCMRALRAVSPSVFPLTLSHLIRPCASLCAPQHAPPPAAQTGSGAAPPRARQLAAALLLATAAPSPVFPGLHAAASALYAPTSLQAPHIQFRSFPSPAPPLPPSTLSSQAHPHPAPFPPKPNPTLHPHPSLSQSPNDVLTASLRTFAFFSVFSFSFLHPNASCTICNCQLVEQGQYGVDHQSAVGGAAAAAMGHRRPFERHHCHFPPAACAMLLQLVVAALLLGQAPTCWAGRPFSEALSEALLGDRVHAAAEAIALALRVSRLGQQLRGRPPPLAVAPLLAAGCGPVRIDVQILVAPLPSAQPCRCRPASARLWQAPCPPPLSREAPSRQPRRCPWQVRWGRVGVDLVQ